MTEVQERDLLCQRVGVEGEKGEWSGEEWEGLKGWVCCTILNERNKYKKQEILVIIVAEKLNTTEYKCVNWRNVGSDAKLY